MSRKDKSRGNILVNPAEYASRLEGLDADQNSSEIIRLEDHLWATDAAYTSAQNDLTAATTVKELERATQRAFDAARASGVTDEQLQSEARKIERVQQRSKTREGHDL